MSNVFTMLHEGGHALYEQGVDPAYNYTSLKGGTSSGMHEAQSRFFENYVGHDEAFAEPLVAVLRRHFPAISIV
jgi:carboxypeptidase Taq